MPRNNLIVLLLAAAGLFSSCRNGNHYSLTGNLPARYDGCLVKLTPATFYFSEEKNSPEDSVKIKNGKFQFNGAVQKPTVYMLTIDGVDYKIPDMASIAVVIEPGDITMEYDTLGIMVSGTPVNERYMATIGEAKRETVRQRQLLWHERDRLEQSATVQTLQQNTEESDNLVDELIEDMVGDSFRTTGNDDWKEAAWQRKLRKQSKVKLRRRKH